MKRNKLLEKLGKLAGKIWEDGREKGYAQGFEDAMMGNEYLSQAHRTQADFQAAERDKIQKALPREELLAQAALKLRRAITGTNPTPVTVEEATKGLAEEFADVTLVASILGYDVDSKETLGWWADKLVRWADRLYGHDSGRF